MSEDEYLVAKVSQFSVNNGNGQILPENYCCDLFQPALRSLDETLDHRQFAEDLVERVALNKISVVQEVNFA